MAKQLTDNERIEYLKYALNLCDIQINEPVTDMVIQLYRKIEQKGGETDLMDISVIRAAIQRKYGKKRRK
jgi:hypothetical protein